MGLHDGMWPSYMWIWLLQRKRAGVSYLQKENQVCMYRRKGKGRIQQSVYVCVCEFDLLMRNQGTEKWYGVSDIDEESVQRC